MLLLGIGDGPANFNAEMHALSKHVVSIDPLYTCSADDIERRFHAVVDNIIEQVKTTPEDWVWTYHHSPEHLRQNRINVLARFIADYEAGKEAGRYLGGELPHLDFMSDQFDLALCSHFLFLYSDHFPYEFHRTAILDMLRVAREVLIFALMPPHAQAVAIRGATRARASTWGQPNVVHQEAPESVPRPFFGHGGPLCGNFLKSMRMSQIGRSATIWSRPVATAGEGLISGNPICDRSYSVMGIRPGCRLTRRFEKSQKKVFVDVDFGLARSSSG